MAGQDAGFWVWCITAIWLALIFYLGTSRFGRAGSQAWIDGLKSQPRLRRLLDRYHNQIRFAGHYVEFTTLTVLLYWAFGGGEWAWSDARGALAYLGCCACAYLDELHQSRTPSRQFRRIDFLHSLVGATLAIGVIYWVLRLSG